MVPSATAARGLRFTGAALRDCSVARDRARFLLGVGLLLLAPHVGAENLATNPSGPRPLLRNEGGEHAITPASLEADSGIKATARAASPASLNASNYGKAQLHSLEGTSSDKMAVAWHFDEHARNFVLDDSDRWIRWPGLIKKITVLESSPVFIQYQVASAAGGDTLFGRISIDGGELIESRSGQSTVKYATNFGAVLTRLSAGDHTIQVDYRARPLPENGRLPLKAAAMLVKNDCANKPEVFHPSEWSVDTASTMPLCCSGSNTCKTFGAKQNYYSYWETINFCFGQSMRLCALAEMQKCECTRGPSAVWVNNHTVNSKQKRFNADSNWMTRSLSVMVLPEATPSVSNPRWTFALKNDIWATAQGLQHTLEVVDKPTPVLAFYSLLMQGDKAHIQARLYRNGKPQPATVSVAGGTDVVHLAGIYVDVAPLGRELWTLKYKVDSKTIRNVEKRIRFKEDSWMTRALSVTKLPNSEVFTAYDTSSTQLLVKAFAWTEWEGLRKNVDLAESHYVIVTYSIACSCMGQGFVAANIFTVLFINGEEKRETRSRTGDAEMCQANGIWTGHLPAGSHVFQLKYQSSAAVRMPSQSGEWGNKALNAIVLPRLAGVTNPTGGGSTSLLETDAAENAKEDVVNIGGTLHRISEVQRLIREARAPPELVGRMSSSLTTVPVSAGCSATSGSCLS